MSPDSLLQLPLYILNSLNVTYTFFLLVVRYSIFMTIVPGIGAGGMGLTLRIPMIMLLSFASLNNKALATLPADYWLMCGQMFCEATYGALIAFFPYILISGMQMAAGLSSTSMGLSASQLIDPTTGTSVQALQRLFSDLTVLIFLFLGGHTIVLYAVSGLHRNMIPGSFYLDFKVLEYIINQSADIFYVGVMISSPVIVALLLTQFVMGLISKAVPQVNIFIVSFPLTIGIGLILTALSLSEVSDYVQQKVLGLEDQAMTISDYAAKQATVK